MKKTKTHPAKDMADGGFKSRKLIFGLLTSAAIMMGAWMAAHSPLFAPQYQVLIGGLLGVYAIFSGANISNKYVVGKTLKGSGATSELETSQDESMEIQGCSEQEPE